MNWQKKLLLAVISLFLSMTLCFGETFLLKDGTRITGDIVSHEDGMYTISASFGIIDIQEADIAKTFSDKEEVKETVQEIKIESTAKARDYVPSYEDEKFHDPLYIAFHQAKFSAVGLTATGAVFAGFGVLHTIVCLPIYYNIDNIANMVPNEQWANGLRHMSLAFILPIILVPAVVGTVLLLACIGPWIYASIMLKKWQSKYHVDMSYNSDRDRLNMAFAIRL